MPRIKSLRSPKRRNLRNKKAIRLAVISIIAIASICTAVILFFNSHLTRISSISVYGGNPTQDMRVELIVSKSIGGDYFWFIPKDFFLFFPSRMLSKSIPSEFPSIAKISFSRKGLTAVAATVVERSPFAVVCINSDNDNCYYTDENGIIFGAASSTQGAFLVYNISLPENVDPIGIDFLDSGRLQALGSFVGDLARIGFIDVSISVSTSTDYDLSLKEVESQKPRAISTSTPIFHLLIDESRSFSETLQDFSAFWQEYMSKATDTDLSLVDMRYGDNIIYKSR